MKYIFYQVTFTEYSNATYKLDLTFNQDNTPTAEEVMSLLETQEPQYFNDLDEMFSSGVVVKVIDNVQESYWKLKIDIQPEPEKPKIKHHINEMEIYKFILSEFNNSYLSDKIKFSIGYYFLDEDGEMGGFSRRFTQENGRFDIKETLNDDTYELENTSFVPMSIPRLNANYLAHDNIKEVTYEPMIEFLVYAEDLVTFRTIELVLQELRAKFIQYLTTLDITYVKEKQDDIAQTETFKVVMMSGEIDYGEIVRVAGKAYLSMSMPLTIEISNIGEYANQEKVYLSVPSVKDNETNEPIVTEIDMLVWNWGSGIDTEPSQLLTNKTVTKDERSKVIRHIPKTTAFSYSMAVYMDFDNPILRKIYIDSRKPNKNTSTEIWTLKSVVTRYDKTQKKFIIDDDLGFEDDFILESKVLSEEISKGDKIMFSLSFVPAWLYKDVV